VTAQSAFDPEVVIAALARYPRVRAQDARVAVVGGFVRDIWLGRQPRELDLLVEGDAAAIARRLGGELTVHEAFGTATACGQDWRVDVAMARRERYPQPGALPIVAPATLEEDLARRDFTVNAIAVTLREHAVLAVPGALEDLAGHRLRILHEQSFNDDPTRALRLARYAQRLGFEVEPGTAARARTADLGTVSGGRVGAELRLILEEPDPIAVLEAVSGLLPIHVDRARLEAALALMPADGDTTLLMLGGLGASAGWLDSLELTARERAIVDACSRAAVPADRTPSALWRAWRGEPVEAVALAGAAADGDGAAAARRYIDEVRHVRLAIGGDELIAAGIREGPEIGRRLTRTLEALLDGELNGDRERQLAWALGARAAR